MAAGEPIGPQITRQDAAVAAQAVPEGRATLDPRPAYPARRTGVQTKEGQRSGRTPTFRRVLLVRR
jgi:hypothetical protein